MRKFCAQSWLQKQGCQILLRTTNQNVKNISTMPQKYKNGNTNSKWTENTPNS
jgi:hypothetical protein